MGVQVYGGSATGKNDPDADEYVDFVETAK